MKDHKYTKLYNTIVKYETIYIYRHLVPDPDAIGSQKALGNLIKENFPDKTVVLVADKSRLVENGFMSKLEDDHDFKGSLSIVLDTANRVRVEGYGWNESSYLVKIDHHPDLDKYGDLQIVDEQASSTCEILSEFFLFVREYIDCNFKITSDIANQLYSGIVGDTLRFFFEVTSRRTLFISSKLMEFGAESFIVNKRIEEKPYAINKLINVVFSDMIVRDDFALIRVNRSTLEELGLDTNDSYNAYFIPNKLREIDKWLSFVEEEELGVFRCSVRSKSDPINTFANKYGGGGHPHASGVSGVREEDIESIFDDFVSTFTK